MPDVAASVLARLKNKANESGRTYQLCLQLFCQEEFLRRFGVGSTEQLPEMNVEQREEIRSEVEEELNLRIDEEGHLLDDDEDPEEDADENENEKEIENNEAYGEDSIS